MLVAIVVGYLLHAGYQFWTMAIERHDVGLMGRQLVVDENLATPRLIELEKSEYAVTSLKLNEMPKINEISHFAHIDYQAFAINDCAACF